MIITARLEEEIARGVPLLLAIEKLAALSPPKIVTHNEVATLFKRFFSRLSEPLFSEDVTMTLDRMFLGSNPSADDVNDFALRIVEACQSLPQGHLDVIVDLFCFLAEVA